MLSDTKPVLDILFFFLLEDSGGLIDSLLQTKRYVYDLQFNKIFCRQSSRDRLRVTVLS